MKNISKKSLIKFIWILGSLSALGPLTIDMYLPGFTVIAKDLGVSISYIQYTLSAYFIGLSIGQIFYGPVADRFGRKLPIIIGFSIFCISSIVCANSTNAMTLIISRFFQALGGSSTIVISRAIVRDKFENKDAVKVFSLLMLVMGIAPIIAPLLGGTFIDMYGWRSIFYFLAAYSFVFIIIVIFFLEETLGPEKRQKKSLKEILGLYKKLTCDSHLMAYTFIGGFTFGAMFAYIAGSPFVFMEIYGIDKDVYAYFFGANAMGLIAGSQINRYFINQYTSEQILRTVVHVIAISATILFCTTYFNIGGFLGLVIPLFIIISCLGFTMPNTTAIAMQPQGRNAGAASALMGTLQFVVASVASSLVGLLHDGTAFPMTVTILISTMMALVTLKLYEVSSNQRIGSEAI